MPAQLQLTPHEEYNLSCMQRAFEIAVPPALMGKTFAAAARTAASQFRCILVAALAPTNAEVVRMVPAVRPTFSMQLFPAALCLSADMWLYALAASVEDVTEMTTALGGSSLPERASPLMQDIRDVQQLGRGTHHALSSSGHALHKARDTAARELEHERAATSSTDRGGHLAVQVPPTHVQTPPPGTHVDSNANLSDTARAIGNDWLLQRPTDCAIWRLQSRQGDAVRTNWATVGTLARWPVKPGAAGKPHAAGLGLRGAASEPAALHVDAGVQQLRPGAAAASPHESESSVHPRRDGLTVTPTCPAGITVAGLLASETLLPPLLAHASFRNFTPDSCSASAPAAMTGCGFSGHVLVCGAAADLGVLLQSVCGAPDDGGPSDADGSAWPSTQSGTAGAPQSGASSVKVVVLAPVAQLQLSENQMRKWRVAHVAGNPHSRADLLRAGALTARAAVVLAHAVPSGTLERSFSVDDLSCEPITAALLLARLNPSLHVVTQLHRGEHALHVHPRGATINDAQRSAFALLVARAEATQAAAQVRTYSCGFCFRLPCYRARLRLKVLHRGRIAWATFASRHRRLRHRSSFSFPSTPPAAAFWWACR